MLTVLLVVQIIICVALVILVLIQKTSSDGLSGLAGGGSGNTLLSGRASANLLTKTTAILATAFMINSLAMATITARSTSKEVSIVDSIATEQQETINESDISDSNELTVPIAE